MFMPRREHPSRLVLVQRHTYRKRGAGSGRPSHCTAAGDAPRQAGTKHWTQASVHKQNVTLATKHIIHGNVPRDPVGRVEPPAADDERCIDEIGRQWIDARLEDEDAREAAIHMLVGHEVWMKAVPIPIVIVEACPATPSLSLKLVMLRRVRARSLQICNLSPG